MKGCLRICLILRTVHLEIFCFYLNTVLYLTNFTKLSIVIYNHEMSSKLINKYYKHKHETE